MFLPKFKVQTRGGEGGGGGEYEKFPNAKKKKKKSASIANQTILFSRECC